MAGRKEFERKAFSEDGMPSKEMLDGLIRLNENQRRELARLNAKCDALAKKLAEEESAHRVTSGIYASTLVRADAAEARLAEAERDAGSHSADASRHHYARSRSPCSR